MVDGEGLFACLEEDHGLFQEALAALNAKKDAAAHKLAEYDATENKDITMGGVSFRIAAGANFKMPVMVTSPGTMMAWSFHLDTDGSDISFEVLRNVDAGEAEAVVEEEKFKTLHGEATKGELLLEQPGSYTLVWNNGHSWLNVRRHEAMREINPAHACDRRRTLPLTDPTRCTLARTTRTRDSD
jgi:hypothetical protein